MEHERQDNWKVAIELYHDLEKYEKSPNVSYRLGMAYLWGMHACKVNVPLAITYLQYASDMGHSEAKAIMVFYLRMNDLDDSKQLIG